MGNKCLLFKTFSLWWWFFVFWVFLCFFLQQPELSNAQRNAVRRGSPGRLNSPADRCRHVQRHSSTPRGRLGAGRPELSVAPLPGALPQLLHFPAGLTQLFPTSHLCVLRLLSSCRAAAMGWDRDRTHLWAQQATSVCSLPALGTPRPRGPENSHLCGCEDHSEVNLRMGNRGSQVLFSQGKKKMTLTRV